MRYLKRLLAMAGVSLLFVTAATTYTHADNNLLPDKKYGDYRDDPKIRHQADSVLKTLSLREKIAQIIIIAYQVDDSQKAKNLQNRLIKDEGLGGVIIMNDPLDGAIKRLNEFHAMAKTPLLVTIDGEWGLSMRFDEIPVFPRQMQLGALSSDSLVYEVGKAFGEECNKLNIHVDFAPDIDINNNINNPVINTRSFGEDREKVAKYGIALSKGMASMNVAGSAKHFPGHGDTDVDSHKGLPVLNFTKSRLDSLELYPFRQLIANGVDMVMVGHLEVKALDETGTISSISRRIITDLLRNEYGYDGIICTDALGMDGVAKASGLDQAHVALEAYKAGVDILLMPEDVENTLDLISNAIKKGELSEEELDGKVLKMLMLKARCGMFEKSYRPFVSRYKLAEKMQSRHNENLIKEIGEKSVTLLTNRGDLLPLGNLNGKKVGVVAFGSREKNSLFNNYVQHYVAADSVLLDSKATVEDIAAAKKAMGQKDIVIFAFNNTDSRPYKNYGIDSKQFDFITKWAAEQPSVAAYMGSPYAYSKIDNVDNFNSFIVGYQSIDANNLATVESIFGAIPTVGVLPVSTGNLKVGESVILSDKTRPQYRFYHNTEPATYTASLQLRDSSAFITLLPLVGKLIENNEFSVFTELGHILMNTEGSESNEFHNSYAAINGDHAKILLWDLMSHRSGLPNVNNLNSINSSNVSELNIEQHTEPVFSNANIYYIRRIIDKYYQNADNTIKNETDNLFELMEMYGSTVNKSGNITTTAKDLEKFLFTIDNNGKYAGKQVFSPSTAKLLKDLLIYYMPAL